MTATEKLRKLLDERGVKWRKTPHYSSESQDNETVFVGSGIEWLANDHMNGRLGLRAARYEVTPEQAVAATVGAQEVYLLMGTDTYDGREYVLGVFSTEEQAEAAISDNRYGYGLHNVQRWEVDA